VGEPGKDPLEAELSGDLRTILEQWDIQPITEIAAFPGNPLVFKVTTVGPTFILKDISDAPNLTRLEFTRNVLSHVAQTGLRVPLPLLANSGRPVVVYHERVYLLTEFIEADEPPSAPELQTEIFYLLLAHWFMGASNLDAIELELRSLDWLHRNYETILNRIISS
jgi:Ser/Thr protein kinase RdoA (MazF antagonist)